MGIADVGNNCDFACWLASLFTFVGGLVEYGRNPWQNYRNRRENERKRREWLEKRKEIFDDYKERYPDWQRRHHSDPDFREQVHEFPRPDYAPSAVDPLMRFYKFYQDTSTFVGGPEKKQSIPAGKA